MILKATVSEVVSGYRTFSASVLKNELQKVIHYRKMSKKRNAGIQHPTFLKDLKVSQNYFGHVRVFVCINSMTRPCKHCTALITFTAFKNFKNSTSASAVSYEQQSLLIIQMNKNTLFSCTPMSDFCERAQQTTALRQRQQLWSYLQTFTKKDSKYEKLFRSVLFVTQTDLSKCSNETGYRLQELILKMKQNTGKRFTLGYISSSCVRSFIGFRIKTGWQSSCFITSQSLVKFGDWASNVAFPWSPTSRNQTSQTSDANKPVDDAHWIFSLFSPLASVNPRDGCDSVKIPVDQQQSATTPRSKSL